MMLAPDRITRYRRKAASLSEAWTSVFHTWASVRVLARIMAVAENETHLGDAGDDHNWGGVHKRGLSAAERMTLHAHGIFATGRSTALRAARALLPAAADEVLYIDTSPSSGPYFVWFWAFPSDVEAAKHFLHELVIRRPSVSAALEAPTPEPMARAMYATKYYEGNHANDPEANIRDYARRIAELEAPIRIALTQPNVPAPPAVLPPAWSPPAGSPPVWAAPPAVLNASLDGALAVTPPELLLAALGTLISLAALLKARRR